MKNVLSNVALNKVMNIMKGGLNSKESLMETNNDTEIVKDLWHEGDKFKVTFHDYEGNVINVQEVVYKENAIPPETPPVKPSSVQYDYVFKGWDKDLIITGDTVFNPVYEEKLRLYNVIFYNASNEIIDEQLVEYGNSAILPSNPIKDPTVSIVYTFSHWDKDTSRITDNMDVYPVFTESPRLYNVNFLNGDGSVLTTQSVEYGSSPSVPSEIPTKTDGKYDYIFKQWENIASIVTGNIDVYPVFDISNFNPNYPITVVFIPFNYISNGTTLNFKTEAEFQSLKDNYIQLRTFTTQYENHNSIKSNSIPDAPEPLEITISNNKQILNRNTGCFISEEKIYNNGTKYYTYKGNNTRPIIIKPGLLGNDYNQLSKDFFITYLY